MEEKLIKEYITKSFMYGFTITGCKDNYKCTVTCNRCDKRFTQNIKINVVDINGENKIQCNLPIYCKECIAKKQVVKRVNLR